MKGYKPETYSEICHLNGNDSDDTGSDTDMTVDLLTELAKGGRVLELAIGSGRVAIPLAERGLPVSGIDAGKEMLERLRQKDGGESIPVSLGNFADVAIEGKFDLVYLIANTLYNLPTQDEQLRCFRNVAEHLNDGGIFLVKTFIPDLTAYAHSNVRTCDVELDLARLETHVHDPVNQTVDYMYVTITRDGIKLAPNAMRYIHPSEMDLMAKLAGLDLRNRWGWWDKSPFTEKSEHHIAVYELSRD